MRNKIGLYSATGIIGLVLMGTTYINIRNRKQDRLTRKLLEKLSAKLNPSTKGLSKEKALEAYYVDKIINSISSKIAVLKAATAAQYAAQIHQAFKPWYLGGDAEETIYGVFRNLKDKVQVSQVAKAYLRDYKLSLKDQLKNKFDAKEIKTVLEIISKLPNYRKL